MGSIHPSVKVGPGAMVDGGVSLGKGCVVGAGAMISGDTEIGENNIIDAYVILGAEPQDPGKYKGGGTLRIGCGNRFREFTTVHRGHLDPGGTIIGDGNYFCSSVHIAHDCKIGNGNFFGNAVLLAGHVQVQDRANFSGHAGVHQFCRIGKHAMIGGISAIRRDILPYFTVQGDPAVHIGLNRIGLRRAGYTLEQINAIGEAFRMMRNKRYTERPDNVYLQEFLEYAALSKRGLAAFGRKGRE
ncbi:MAG: acyl-ACP--UDP-N-acetylglucosamine O-acyltransferase [Planctomycetes bacterium]|nr:acyl-ACP--UDP-N-acetylglucosamine O-acyltransferase [Planctomycetota bacterium]